MVGASVFVTLNRLQMLNQGQQHQRPDSRQECKQETLLAPLDPTRNVTNCWVTSFYFFQHTVISLPTMYVQTLPDNIPHIVFIDTLSAKFMFMFSSVLICSYIFFHLFHHPLLCFENERGTSLWGREERFIGNANKCRSKFILVQRNVLFSQQPDVEDKERNQQSPSI